MRDWENIPKQTFLVEDGKVGDCWRCCIAAILGLLAEDVPHFNQAENGLYNNQGDEDTQKWLNRKGFAFIYVNGPRNIFVPYFYNERVILPLISCGPTERSKGMGKHHAVVTIGSNVVYDPHPSESGLTAITEQYLIFKLVN